MDYRTGKCSQCGAEYKVPASFAHNVARCKVCKGVVHLGPPPAKTAGPPVEGGRGEAPGPRGEPSPASVKPAAPRSVRPDAPAAKKTQPSTSAARPAPESPAAWPASPARPVAAAPGSGARAAAPEPASSPARGRSHPDAAHDSHGHRNARHARPEKKPPVAGIISALGLVAAGLALFLFKDQLFGSGDAGETGSGPSLAQAPVLPAATPAAPAPEPASMEEDSSSSLKAAPTEELDSPSAPSRGAEDRKPDAPATKIADPSSIDLTQIQDFGPIDGTTEEEWAAMNEWMGRWMDVEAGAAGNKAKLQLVEKKRKAIPVILNAFKRQDFATKEGRSNGDQCQKSLMQICYGTNFDWKYADEAAGRPVTDPNDVYYCKRVVESWSKLWRKGQQDVEYWIRSLNLEVKDPGEAKRLREEFGGKSEAASSAEDEELDVD